MNCNFCYRGISYRPTGAQAGQQVEQVATASRRPPVILRYRGLLYISGGCNFAGTFLKP